MQTPADAAVDRLAIEFSRLLEIARTGETPSVRAEASAFALDVADMLLKATKPDPAPIAADDTEFQLYVLNRMSGTA